jgi:hypothetical protein
MRNIGSRSFDACLNHLKKSLQDQPAKDGIKFLDLSCTCTCTMPERRRHEDSKHHREQDETSRLTQTHHHRQDCHLNAQLWQQAPPPPPLPRQDREPPPPPQQAEHSDSDWIAANVGKVSYNSLRILGLREGATEGEVKAAYKAMSRIYHPDKHNSGFTGVWWGSSWILSTSEQCTQLFTRDNVTNTEERKKYERSNYELWFGHAGRKDIPSQQEHLFI